MGGTFDLRRRVRRGRPEIEVLPHCAPLPQPERKPRNAIQYVVAKDAALFKSAEPRIYRLSQVADFVCGIELTAIKYEAGAQTATDQRFFGGANAFEKNS